MLPFDATQLNCFFRLVCGQLDIDVRLAAAQHRLIEGSNHGQEQVTKRFSR